MDREYKIKEAGLGELTDRLRIEDLKYSRLSRIFKIVYWVLVPIYTVLAIREWLDAGVLTELISGLCMVASMLIFALLFGKFQKQYRDVNYALSTTEMLKEAIARYTPFQIRTAWVWLAVVFMDISLCFNSSLQYTVVDVQIYFLGSIGIAVGIGLIIWRIKYKDLRDHASRLLKEIMSE